jgi:hypothetical protein
MGQSFLADIPGNFFLANLGTVAAIASNGANARPNPVGFVAPGNLRLLSVWKHNLSASEVTVGTATSSASYRRHRILNGGSAGSATTIMASLNATASAPASGARSFSVDTTVTAAAGDVIYYDQLTVGAATADGTDAAACGILAAYQLI